MNQSLNQSTVYIVDDDELHLHSLRKLLTQNGLRVQGFNSADAFFLNPEISHPCVLLLDMRMPKKDGLFVQNKLAELNIVLPIIFLSGQAFPEEIIKSFKNGIFDFITKPFDCNALISTIESAIQFDYKNQTLLEQRMTTMELFNTLTDREKEIYRHLNEGLLSTEIAERLNITPRTIKAHKSQIMAKMNSDSAQDLLKKWLLINE